MCTIINMYHVYFGTMKPAFYIFRILEPYPYLEEEDRYPCLELSQCVYMSLQEWPCLKNVYFLVFVINYNASKSPTIF